MQTKELKQKQRKKSRKELETLQESKNRLAKEIADSKTQKQSLNKQVADLRNLIVGIDELKRQIIDFKERFSHTFLQYEIKPEEILKFELDSKLVRSKIEKSIKEIEIIDEKLDFSDEKSLASQETVMGEKIKEVKNKLSEPFRKYQKYLELLEQWQKRELELKGDAKKKIQLVIMLKKSDLLKKT
ncbi:MAG: hypothetical protein HC831_09865 [Chloroflexia bacterium]|nr:hypothetical protein [Chloroflexia bacterium]